MASLAALWNGDQTFAKPILFLAIVLLHQKIFAAVLERFGHEAEYSAPIAVLSDGKIAFGGL